jgi:hypothetical protein
LPRDGIDQEEHISIGCHRPGRQLAAQVVGGQYVIEKKMAAECIHSGWGAVIF